MSDLIKPIQPIAEQVMASPKTAAVVASASMGIGIGSTIDLIQGILAIVLTSCSIVLTGILIYKNLKKK